MNTQTITTPKLLAASMLALALLSSLAIMHVEAAANDSSINIKKDIISDSFTLTIRDPDGIQEFSLSPVVQSRYGGLLSGCKTSFSSNNISFVDPVDFKPVMPAYVVDCKNNTTELEIPPPVNGVARSVLVKKETPLPSPPPPKEEKKEERKEGPLSAQDIQYPVPGLGNCQNEAECRSYCDNADRAKECFAFAKKYNLISLEKAKEAADEFLNVKNGPGGCNSGASCETYCNNVDHLDACISFAEKSGYYSPAQLAEAKKFQELVKVGKQFPGGCKDRNACEVYCGDPNHMEECLNFAEENQFIPKEEIEEARKILPLMKRGETPGKCTSKEQCETYCSEEGHNDECIAFGEKAGFISAEDAAMIKKSGGKGPGGCHSKKQCEAYCENNSDACFQWAQDNGSFSEADLAKMKKGMTQFKEQLDKIPPEVTKCLKDSLGEKNFDKLINGKPIFDRSMEGKMKSCFSQLTSQVSKQFNTLPPEAAQCIKDTIGEDGLRKLQSGEFDENFDFQSLEGCFQKLQSSFGGGGGGPGGQGGFAGPGGCRSIDECSAYCQSNLDACKDFAPQGGGQGGGFPGSPGGCKSQEECMAYCKDHPDECKNFSPPGGGFQGGSGGGQEMTCSPKGTVASFVCGKNGKNAPPDLEVTYFNSCTAEQHGAEILHEGVCKGHLPCADIADPVCGNDGNTWVSACYAQEQGGGVKYEGVCKVELGGGGKSIGGGPGGCRSVAECTVYCQSHPQECGVMPSSPPHPASNCAPLPSGLVSWWDEDTLSKASGGVTLAPGKVGNAFKFAGAGGHINIGNLPSLNFGTGPFSFEFWFLWDGTGNINNIIRKSNYPVSGPGAGYWLRVGANKLEFFAGETTGIDGQPRGIVAAPISPNVWYYVVASRDDSGTMSLYVDGQLKGTAQGAGANTTSEATFTLGAWDDRFGVTELFSGILDEVTVYNRALSVSEVESIFNAGSAGKCTVQSSSSQGGVDYQQQFQQQYQQNQSPTNYNYSGPGGCKTQEECIQYCTAHYQDPACSGSGR